LNRKAEFLRQARAWRKEGRSGVPMLAMPNISWEPGRCISCGLDPKPNEFRCPACVSVVAEVIKEMVSVTTEPKESPEIHL
jgi:hypothetical protein